MSSQSKLLHVVAALHTTCSFASGLNRWQQQTNQNPNDCNNNQKFHQCETLAVRQHTLSHRKTLYKKTKNKNNIMRTVTNLEGCSSALFTQLQSTLGAQERKNHTELRNLIQDYRFNPLLDKQV
jgi:hypothetical protein